MKQSAVLLKENIYSGSSGNKIEIMDQPKDHLDSLLDRTKDYVETRMELLKLKSINKAADVVSTIASKLAMFVAMLFFFVFLNIGLALLIGHWIGESYYGFLILAVIYLITGLLFKSNGDKWFKAPVADQIIKKLFN
jgi:putative superfamily III holin-X